MLFKMLIRYKEIRRQQFVILILRMLNGIRINKYFLFLQEVFRFNGRSVIFDFGQIYLT